jgi:hypothetical protein
MLAAIDVGGHDAVIGAVQEYLAEELDGLPFCDIAVGLDENVVILFEE